jgi:hypothetical protein
VGNGAEHNLTSSNPFGGVVPTCRLERFYMSPAAQPSSAAASGTILPDIFLSPASGLASAGAGKRLVSNDGPAQDKCCH